MKKQNIIPYLTHLMLLLGATIALMGCGNKFTDPPKEDYSTLFPFQGIDKPQRLEGEVIIKKGDPKVTRKTFVYPGDPTLPQLTKYKVTLKYIFSEAESIPKDEVHSRYTVRFANEEGELVSIHSDPLSYYLPPDELEDEDNIMFHDFEMDSGKSYTHTFKATSGFALFLCVNGHGERGSRISASLTATSLDGSVEPITLKVEGQQPFEGMVQLFNPYCEYAILP